MLINWKKEIFSIPNLLSLFRLLMIPIYIVIYLNAAEPYEFFLAGVIIAVSCLSDMIDGKIARRYNMITTLGKILDPLADKVTQFTLTLCLSLKYSVLNPVLALFLVKEIFQICIGVANLFKHKMLPGALMAGKVCTAVLFISLITLVLFPDMNPLLVNCIALTDTFFMLFSFISYIFAYFGKNTKVQDLEAN